MATIALYFISNGQTTTKYNDSRTFEEAKEQINIVRQIFANGDNGEIIRQSPTSLIVRNTKNRIKTFFVFRIFKDKVTDPKYLRDLIRQTLIID